MLTNNIAGVAAKRKHERDALEKDMKVLQEQFNEQSEKLNVIQEKLASYTPRNVNKRQKRAQSKTTDLKTKVSELEEEKNTISGQLDDQTKELNDIKQKYEQAENEVVQLKHQKTGLQKKVWHLQKHKGMQAKEIDSLKDHNAAMILKLESSADELKEKNKELEQLTCLLEDETINTFENGKYVDEVREVIMDLLAMNVSMSKVNEVIRTVLQKLAGKSISRLPSKAVHSRLLVEAKHLADVQLGRAMLEEADPSQVIGNTLHGDGTTKYRHYQDFEVTTPSCQTYSMGLLELGKSDTEAIMDAFKHRVEEIAQALSSGDEKASVENKVAELVTSIKSTMSDQGPTNATFNEQLAELRKDFLPKVVEKWQDLTEN